MQKPLDQKVFICTEVTQSFTIMFKAPTRQYSSDIKNEVFWVCFHYTTNEKLDGASPSFSE